MVADFDGTSFEHAGMTARFRVEGDAYHVAVTETDGVTTDYRVHSVAGIEPLQQYLLETEPGRLQSFDVVWDTEAGGWFHLYPDRIFRPMTDCTGPAPTRPGTPGAPSATRRATTRTMTPRRATTPPPRPRSGSAARPATVPGQAHLDWAGDTSQTPPAGYGFSQPFATTEATIQQCATCHSRREAHDDASPLPGTPYHEAYGLELLRTGAYHADGQILDEVYVYGSFLQSKMYAQGVGCLDCHDAHSAGLVAEGNAVCTQCHAPAGNPDFPTLKPAAYDAPEHHFHEPGSESAQCKNCHAPERVYMGNDWRADHSFRIPRPDLAAETGAPDACTTCHTDRHAGWAAAEIAARFPDSTHRGPHYGQTLARGRADAVATAGDLAALASDETEPGIVRATALWLLEQANSPVNAGRVAGLLSDPDPLVRITAIGAQRMADPQDRVLRVLPLLADPVRSVRIEAAKALLDAPIARLPGPAQVDLDAAMTEWRAALASRLDFPETHLQLAGIALTMRAFPQAEAAFRETVRLDPQRAEAWVMLVRIAAALRGPGAARLVLEEAMQAAPADPALMSLERSIGEN